MSTLESLVEAALAQISEEFPSGADARYDPDYEAVGNWIRDLDLPGAAEPPWASLVDKCWDLLTSVTKDIRLGCYLTFGLFARQGVVGLAAGLQVVTGLCERYWEDCWPSVKRPRARCSAVDWLTDQVRQRWGLYATGTDDARAVAQFQEAAEQLKSMTRERFPAGFLPKTQPLCDLAERLWLDLPEEARAELSSPPVLPGDAAAAAAAAAQSAVPALPMDGLENPRGELDELIRLYVAPLAGPSPAGENCRDDDEYEAVRQQVGRLDSPSGEPVQWPEVERLCSHLLRHKTKDFWLAAFLTEAAYRHRGLAGLAEGSTVFAELTDAFWDHAFPAKRRMRGRRGAVEWLLGRFEVIATEEITVGSHQEALLCEQAARRFEEVVAARFGPDPPGMEAVHALVEAVLAAVPAEPEPPPAVEEALPEPDQGGEPAAAPGDQAPDGAAAAPGDQAPDGAAAAPAEPPAEAAPAAADAAAGAPAAGGTLPLLAQPEDAPAFLATVCQALSQAANVLLAADPQAPQSFRWRRAGAFLPAESAPAAVNGPATALAPPSESLEHKIYELGEGGKWPALLQTAEGAVTEHPYWLDLHFYVTVALAELGFDEARRTVIEEIGSLLKRLPQLRELTYADGRPFAGPHTISWLDNEVLGPAGPAEGGGAGGPPGAGAAPPENPRLADARRAAEAGELGTAYDMLGQLCRGAESGLLQFRARLALGQLLAANQDFLSADGIYSGALDAIDRFQLEQWEPELAVQCYEAHCEVLRALRMAAGTKSKASNAGVNERLNELYSRLCRVSPSAALRLRASGLFDA